MSNKQYSMSNEQVKKCKNNTSINTTCYFPTFETESGE